MSLYVQIIQSWHSFFNKNGPSRDETFKNKITIGKDCLRGIISQLDPMSEDTGISKKLKLNLKYTDSKNMRKIAL